MAEQSIKLTETQKKSACDHFKHYDKKGEDKMRVNDISKCLGDMGQKVKGDWLEKLEGEIDTEGTGYIDSEEFLRIFLKKLQSDEDERELKELFRVLDKEKKGEVNTNEIRWILKSVGDDLTEEDIDAMICDVDTDGSGFVDYDEFYKLMMTD